MKTSHKALGAITAAVLMATPLVANFEGLWLTAKPDKLAYNIPTVCYGETEGVKVGDTYTKQQCMDMLAKKLPRYADEIAPCIKVPISDKTRASFISLAYNIGSAGTCKSTAVKKLNTGDGVGACNAMMSWNRAGGRVVQGLTNRRTMEKNLCLEGLKEPAGKNIPVTTNIEPTSPANQVVDTPRPKQPIKKKPVTLIEKCEGWGWFRTCEMVKV